MGSDGDDAAAGADLEGIENEHSGLRRLARELGDFHNC